MNVDKAVTRLWLQRTSGRIVARLETDGPAPDMVAWDGKTWHRAIELPSFRAVVYHVERAARRSGSRS